MNIYFLVEGDTEYLAYSNIIKEICPGLTQIFEVGQKVNNNYYIFNGGGYPSILNMIKPAIEDALICHGYDKLVIVFDCDENNADYLSQMMDERLLKLYYQIDFDLSNVQVIIQNRCFETWCLGNTNEFPEAISIEFENCKNHYNVSILDPEEMPRDPELQGCNTVQQYHKYYLRKMFREKRWIYNVTSRTNKAFQPEYIKGIIKRALETGHLKSFNLLYNFLHTLKTETPVDTR